MLSKTIKKAARLFLVLVVLSLLSVTVLAQSGTITMVAVSESENGTFTGSVADLTLDVRAGTGRVFIETLPLSKIDTQISTRFAKDIACSFIDADCSKYDFFYTISAPATIVGGPSGGAAISVLTVAVLEGLTLNDKVTITGTISSGHLVGPVGSISNKIEAAHSKGFSTILIPKGQMISTEKNITVNMTALGDELNITVTEVSTLEEALFEFTGVDYSTPNVEIEITETYNDVMRSLAIELCNRSTSLVSGINNFDLDNLSIITPEFVGAQKAAINTTAEAADLYDQGKFYASASACFRANVALQRLLKQMSQLDENKTTSQVESLILAIDEFESVVDAHELSTLTDLQAYTIVKERLLEAKNFLSGTHVTADVLAYATERLYSAASWSHFFNKDQSQPYVINRDVLHRSCVDKLSEVQESIQYINLLYPRLTSDIESEYDDARAYYTAGDYELCLAKASQVKGRANVFVSLQGLTDEVYETVLDNKLDAAKRAIVRQISTGGFPIQAYSYFEYANALREDDPYSAMLYTEYALELSNIDIYFKERTQTSPYSLNLDLNDNPAWMFIWGVLLGYLLCFVTRRIGTGKTKLKTRKAIRLRD